MQELLARGADSVIADLADLEQTMQVADQVNALGAMDAVIHNAGVYSGSAGVYRIPLYEVREQRGLKR